MKRPAAVFGFTALFTIIAVSLTSETAAYILFAASGILYAACAVLRRKRLSLLFITVAAAVCVSFLSYKAAYEIKYKPAASFDGKTVTVSGTAEDFPRISGDYTAVKITGCTFDGNSLGVGVMFYGKELPDIRPGDKITLTKATLNAAVKTEKYFLHSLSQNSYFSVFSVGNVSCSAGERSGPEYKILSLRRAVSNRLKLSLSARAYPIADALITGSGSRLPDDFSRELQIAGASHIFAVSGMHLSLWTVVLFFVFGSTFGCRPINNIIGALFVMFFIPFTGKSPSVIRAGIMLLTAFAGNLVKKPSDALNSLGLATAVCVIANPFICGNVSFLLSTVSTAAVIAASHFAIKTPANSTPFYIKKLGAYAVNTLTASAFVIVFTLPVTSFFFGSVSLLGGISSILCTLPAEGVMLSGALGAALFGKTKICGFSFYVCEKLCTLIISVIKKLSDLDFFVVPLNGKRAAVFFAALIFITALSYALIKRDRRAAAVCSCFLCISVAAALSVTMSAFAPKQTEIYIPGKNGDILITENGGENTVIIGISGTYDSVSAVTAEMTANGATNADLLIIPHGVRTKTRFKTDYAPTSTVHSDGSSDFIPDGTAISEFSLRLSDTTVLKYTRKNGFCGCMLISKNIKTAFIFSGKAVPVPDEYLTASCMVFRKDAPENTYDCTAEKIFLASDPLADGALCASGTDGIKITIK